MPSGRPHHRRIFVRQPWVQLRLKGTRKNNLFIVLLYKGCTQAQVLGSHAVKRVHHLF